MLAAEPCRSCGRRRRSLAPWACRRRSGRSPGRAGQALAGYALDLPALIAGKRALDFAPGSGLVAIAVAKAGAAGVEASDINPFGADDGWEVVLADDVAYERDLAGTAMDWLESLGRRGTTALIGDTRRSYLPHERLDCVIEYSAPVTRELEDSELACFVFGEQPLADADVLDGRARILTRSSPMRVAHMAIVATVLAIPTVGYAQDSGAAGGPVGGPVGPNLGGPPNQTGPSVGHPYGSPPRVGHPAGHTGSIAPGQLVPRNVTVTPRPGGMGSAVIEGHHVLVDPTSNRVIRVFN
jgi:predicted nicotinamide N-methyase